MKAAKTLYLRIATFGILTFLTAWPVYLSGQQSSGVRIDNDDIGGVVPSAKGPEAGVWVIAETPDLPTRIARMVVTDGEIRALAWLPD